MEMPIPGYHGYYATAEGEIISRRRGMPRILVQSINRYGYKIVTLYDNQSRKGTRYVHQLILEAHGFMRSIERNQVRHLDGDRTNNHLDNLDWGSQSDNYADRVVHGTDVASIRQRLDWNRSKGSRGGSFPVVSEQNKTGAI